MKIYWRIWLPVMILALVSVALSSWIVLRRPSAVSDRSGADGRGGQEIFPVTVDYDMPLRKAIAAGRFDWAMRKIAEEARFPSASHGQAELRFVIVRLEGAYSPDGAKKEIGRRGHRPATIHELLAFGAKYPDAQRKRAILSLGTTFVDSRGTSWTPYLGGNPTERYVNLMGIEKAVIGDRWLINESLLCALER